MPADSVSGIGGWLGASGDYDPGRPRFEGVDFVDFGDEIGRADSVVSLALEVPEFLACVGLLVGDDVAAAVRACAAIVLGVLVAQGLDEAQAQKLEVSGRQVRERKAARCGDGSRFVHG